MLECEIDFFFLFFKLRLMNQVTVISRGDEECSCVWLVSCLSLLTQSNKISSNFFVAPAPEGSKGLQHQIRFVLCKGMARGEPSSSESDSVGLAVEYQISPAEARPPGNTEVTARVFEERGDTVLSEAAESQVLSVGRCVPLPTLFPPGLVQRNAPTAAYRVELTIRFNAPSLLPHLSAAGNTSSPSDDSWSSWGAGLWGGVSSAIAGLVSQSAPLSNHWTSLVGDFDPAKLQELVAETVTSLSSQSKDAVTKAEEARRPTPWSPLPDNWSDRPQAWRKLIQVELTSDVQTFLVGPNIVYSDEDVDRVEQIGMSIDQLRALYSPSADIHEGLLIPEIAAPRYHLVPAELTEEEFWARYYWKAACLGLCAIDEEVRILLSVLNQRQWGDLDVTPVPPRPPRTGLEEKGTTPRGVPTENGWSAPPSLGDGDGPTKKKRANGAELLKEVPLLSCASSSSAVPTASPGGEHEENKRRGSVSGRPTESADTITAVEGKENNNSNNNNSNHSTAKPMTDKRKDSTSGDREVYEVGAQSSSPDGEEVKNGGNLTQATAGKDIAAGEEDLEFPRMPWEEEEA